MISNVTVAITEAQLSAEIVVATLLEGYALFPCAINRRQNFRQRHLAKWSRISVDGILDDSFSSKVECIVKACVRGADANSVVADFMRHIESS